MGYKLTWVYIGQTKVRPSGWGWWQPWANTLAYRPFKSDLNEASWKTWLDWNITRWSVSYSNNMATINTLRIPSMIFTWAWDYTILTYRTSSDTNFWFRLRNANDWFPKQQLDVRWHAIYDGSTWYECFNSNPNTSLLLATAVRENNDLYYYENGVLVNQITAPSISITWWPWISMWAFWTNNTSWSVGNLIVENKARTVQEILDYFNQTKSDYGL